MLQTLRDHSKGKYITLNSNFKKYLKWFTKFLHQFNGSSFFKKRKFHHFVDLYACLTGMGAVCGTEIYQTDVPYEYIGSNFATIEMYNIYVAIGVWANDWAKTSVIIV